MKNLTFLGGGREGAPRGVGVVCKGAPIQKFLSPLLSVNI